MVYKFLNRYFFGVLFLSFAITIDASEISIVRENGKLIIKAGDDLFTQYIYEDEKRASKANFISCTRSFSKTNDSKISTRREVRWEEADHPHHTSLWYTHGDVNGVDFWAVGENKGKIIHQEFLNLEGNTFTSSNFWKDGQGKTICQDERTFHFYEFTKNERAIDIKITLMATVEDLVLGDTKRRQHGNKDGS